MATENEYYIPLENVDSEHCAMIVDKGLAGIGTVSAHRVELNNNRAVISAPKIYQALPDVVKTIRGLGYGVTTVKKNWPVMNMTCASCANTVDSVLAYQPGVVAANVNFANATVQVEYIPGMTDAHKLRAAVQAVGYDLMIDESEDAKDSLENAQQASSRALRRKTWGAVILSVPLVVIAMVPAWMNESWANYVMWVLATPVVFYFGSQFFVGAWKQLRHRSANMDTLVALSTGVAYVFSVFNTLFPHYWHERGLHAHVYFEASAVVIAFVLLGKLLEEKAKNNTSSAIKKLIGLQPKTVTMIHGNGHQMEMPIGSVQLGNILLVKPGEKIPVDGTVTTGTSYVDESTITGEPVPVAKKADDKVLAGTINQKGSFQMRADKVGSTTLLAQIIQTVQEAQGSKAPVQKLVDKIAGIFVPVVIIIAVLSAIVWWIFGGENGLAQGLVALVTVLVIACPCALGLATPTAIMVGMGNGAEKGILIKDAESLEKLQKINAIVLDKTGTITEGHPEVNDLKWLEQSNSEWVNILYSIEKSSEHPLAEAIVKYLGKEAQFIPSVAVENVTGQGITGIYNQVKYFVGNAVFLSQNNLPIEDSATQWAQTYLDKANTVVFFANTEKILAGIAIADRIKPSSAQAVAQLQKSGIEVFMLTGDNEQTAKAVARQTGIQHIQANVLPQDKSAFVRKLQSQGKTVAMVGDGINDSSALAQADVGIAMGHGSDIAMDVAQMTIVSSDLQKIPLGIELSKATSKTIRQNLFWAFIYNIIGIPLAAGVLYPVNGFLLNPMIAGAAMALSSVSVVANSLRGRWK